ncbi:MAG: DnaJ- protein scj1 [Alectoria sarmentosa]|nr:MAG: DnaJ- protein scj1 [Alectoria sarmentosa]
MLFIPALILAFLLPLVLCVEDFYKLLDLDKSASDREIKKAYRLLSKKYHPDKNPGNESASEKFVQIAEAYDALSEPETRRIYDQYGYEGLKQHQQGGQGGRSHDPFDLFSRFFGGSGHFGHQSGQRRGPDMEVRVSVPLSDFYNGHEHEFSIEKQQICEEGMVIQKHMLAPGIFQQVQMGCDKCGGKGKTIKHPCKVCGGSRVVKKTASHTLHVEKGMPKGSRIVYENEADESPDWVAGDLVVQVGEKEAEYGDEGQRTDGAFFRRKGRDMFWKEVLSLREAWMGDWERNLTHLDGHVVRLGRTRGEVVQPNQVEVVNGEGMPVWLQEEEQSRAGEEEFGQLHVDYTVVLPDQVERPMEKEFWALWEKWRKKIGVNLAKDSGRPRQAEHSEL